MLPAFMLEQEKSQHLLNVVVLAGCGKMSLFKETQVEHQRF
jgi:hypothetical protein